MGLPKEIAAFMATYKVDADEIWKIPQGTAYAVKHKALERVAAEQNITFEAPGVIEARSGDKIAALIVYGRMGDRVEWSIGEAAPGNNKNNYPFAMAEKRGKDRVTLKLLQAHGALYSEDEADDFKRQNPHVTTPTDIIGDPIEYDQNGHPVDNIPLGDPEIGTLKKKDARKDFEAAQKEMRATKTVDELKRWGDANANRIASYPTDWAEIFRGLYREHQNDLRKQMEAA